MFRERDRGEDRRIPCAEVLGAEILAGELLQLLVDVVGANVAPGSAVPVGEELRPAGPPCLERLERWQHRGIGDYLDVAHRSLGAEVEHGSAALDSKLALLQRRDPVRLVLGCVALRADAEEPQIEEPDRAPEHALADQPAEAQSDLDALANRWEGPGECLHLLELLPVAVLAPRVVVQVLLAAGVVVPGCLNVSSRVGANPDIRPCGRDRERADPVTHLAVLDWIVVLIEVGEPPAATDAPDARRGTIDPP